MFPNNYGHTGSDDGYAPLTSAQNHVQNDTLRQSPALPACRLVGAQIDRYGGPAEQLRGPAEQFRVLRQPHLVGPPSFP